MIILNGNRVNLNNNALQAPAPPTVNQLFGSGVILAHWDFSNSANVLDASSNPCVDGTAVRFVNDLSGNGRQLFQNNASIRPVYNVVNGIGRVRSNTVSDFLCINDNIVGGLTQCSVFMYSNGGFLQMSGTSYLHGRLALSVVGVQTPSSILSVITNYTASRYKSGVYADHFVQSNMNSMSRSVIISNGATINLDGNTFLSQISGGFNDGVTRSTNSFTLFECVVVGNIDITDRIVNRMAWYFFNKFKNA